VATPPITDPVWGGEVALDLKEINGSCLWGEIGAGIKVNIAKGFHMGWSVRYKVRFTEKIGKNYLADILRAVNMIKEGMTEKKAKLAKVDSALTSIESILQRVNDNEL
jgi:hypothetical protein